jgi:titin
MARSLSVTAPRGSVGKPGPDNTIGGTAGFSQRYLRQPDRCFHCNATQNIVQGNLIGTVLIRLNPVPACGADINITTANANTSVELLPAPGTSSRETVSGFPLVQVRNQIRSKAISSGQINGTEPLGNLDGVRVDDATNNVIGVAVNPTTGAVAGAGNVISGNLQNGIDLERISSGANANYVAGNFIGVDLTGTKKLPNSFSGVLINASSSNSIGGNQAALRNVIANGGSGVNVLAIGDQDCGRQCHQNTLHVSTDRSRSATADVAST